MLMDGAIDGATDGGYRVKLTELIGRVGDGVSVNLSNWLRFRPMFFRK